MGFTAPVSCSFLCAFEKLCCETSEVLFEQASFECKLEMSSCRNPRRFSTSRKFGVMFKDGLRLMTLGRQRDTLGT